MRPSDGWKKVRARQYYCTAQPGYVWAATINLAPLMWIRGWDSYLKGADLHIYSSSINTGAGSFPSVYYICVLTATKSKTAAV